MYGVPSLLRLISEGILLHHSIGFFENVNYFFCFWPRRNVNSVYSILAFLRGNSQLNAANYPVRANSLNGKRCKAPYQGLFVLGLAHILLPDFVRFIEFR
jgi:hypothetical protein